MGEGLKRLLKDIDESHKNLSYPIGGKTISRVILSWYVGEAYEAGSVTTDGDKLLSYNLCIGETEERGRKTLHNYTSRKMHGIPSLGFVSMTTSTHVGRAFTLLSELNLVLGHLLHEVMDGDTDAAYAESEDAEGAP